jgi:hypothetical protein
MTLGWKGLPGTNIQAYWAHLYVKKLNKVLGIKLLRRPVKNSIGGNYYCSIVS